MGLLDTCDLCNLAVCYYVTNPNLKSAKPGTTAPVLAMPTSITVTPVCLECGISQKSGKSSCCARGGAWFGNCGHAGDRHFGHTWAEGIQSCKSRLLGGSALLCFAVYHTRYSVRVFARRTDVADMMTSSSSGADSRATTASDNTGDCLTVCITTRNKQ